MAATVLAGLAASSYTTAATAIATFDNVNVVAGTPAPPPTLPAGWSHQDVGVVGVAGSAALNTATNVYSVKGAGADIWGTANAFHYAYKAMTGDGVAIARVATVQNTNAWTKACDSRNAYASATASAGRSSAATRLRWARPSTSAPPPAAIRRRWQRRRPSTASRRLDG
jgi:hypothetical protein